MKQLPISQLFVIASFSVLFLSGCSTKMTPLAIDEIQQINQEDRSEMMAGVQPITAPVSIEEAMARALKHNLELRTRMLEVSLAAGHLEAGRYDMLPKLMANAGYEWRDKDSTRRAVDSVTGAPSLANPFISSDREHVTRDLGLSWSVLDFGVGYYHTKQNADRLMIAHERRRKAMHTLMQQVRTAFWRAAAADKLSVTIRSTIVEAESALKDSRQVSAIQVRAPLEALRYQRTLLENLRLLEGVERELATARIELSNLMGLPPGTAFMLVEPNEVDVADVTMPMERLEEVALMNNADLREQFYNVRIAAAETRKALLRMLPNLSFNYTYRYDDDSYLIHENWSEAGIRVGYNLLNLLATPSRIRAAEWGVSVARNRRMALQMSVVTQVHLARHQLSDAIRQYERSVEIYEVDNALAGYASSLEDSKIGNRLDRISANVTNILSSIRRYHALAKVHQSASQLQASLGLEPELGSLDEYDLGQLTGLMRQSLQQWSVGLQQVHPEMAVLVNEGFGSI
jgi:outer membrane protein TolC